MRVFSVPARYLPEIEAAVARAVDLIRLDEHRRSHGEQPLVPSFQIDPTAKGHTVIIVGLDSDRLVSAAEHHLRRRAAS